MKIGCTVYDIDHWLSHYKEIGKASGYSTKDIKIYGKKLAKIKKLILEEEQQNS